VHELVINRLTKRQVFINSDKIFLNLFEVFAEKFTFVATP